MYARLRRLGPAVLFGASAITFALPFGSGVLDGARVWPRVSFTGIELATWRVEHKSQFVPAGRAAVREFEAGASLPAAILFALVISGLALALLDRRGGGICAAAAVAALLWLFWQLGDTQLIGGNRIDLTTGFTVLELLVVSAAIWHFAFRRRKSTAARPASTTPSRSASTTPSGSS